MKKVLLVDDNRELLFLMREYLASYGITCDLVNNVAEARDCLRRERYEMIVSDLNMPGESGLDLFRYASSLFPDTSLVLMTGSTDPHVKREARALGIHALIEKPFFLGDLAKLINRRFSSASSLTGISEHAA